MGAKYKNEIQTQATSLRPQARYKHPFEDAPRCWCSLSAFLFIRVAVIRLKATNDAQPTRIAHSKTLPVVGVRFQHFCLSASLVFGWKPPTTQSPR